MKIRNGFISNSSSTAFIIHNKTPEVNYNTVNLDSENPYNEKYLVDFVKEVVEETDIVESFNDMYVWEEEDYITEEDLIKSAENNNKYITCGKSEIIFGDEQGTLVGRVFDYMLRDGGETETFSWEFGHWLR